jgi:hypothetical protein
VALGEKLSVALEFGATDRNDFEAALSRLRR